MSNQWNNKCPIIETTDVHSMKQQMSKQWNNKCLINETMSNQWNKCPLNETTNVHSMKQQMLNLWSNRCPTNESTDVESMKQQMSTRWKTQTRKPTPNTHNDNNRMKIRNRTSLNNQISYSVSSWSSSDWGSPASASHYPFADAGLSRWLYGELQICSTETEWKKHVWLEVTCLVFAALLPTLNEWQKPCSLACLN